MRILALTRYSRLGASTRLRTLQYLPSLEAAGFQVEVAPFFDDDYLTDLYSGRRAPLRTLSYFTRRIQRLRKTGGFDLIWIEKEALPWMPWFVERFLLNADIPYVVDYDDAIFHRYDQSVNWFVRTVLGRKIDNVMANAACVFAGNQYLADRAYSAGARRIEIIPTVVDMDRYQGDRIPCSDGKLRLGWIGTPQTWRDVGYPLFVEIADELERAGVIFRAVGASLSGSYNGNLEVIPWSEKTEVESILGMDIGVMPLVDTPWARGKCGYKLIQYMACGLPVIASSVGANSEIVRHGVDGFLADDLVSWRSSILSLCADPSLRAQMGSNAKERVGKKYSLQVWGHNLAVRLVEQIEKSGV